MIGTARHRHTATILLRAENGVGKFVVGDDVIELRGRLVVPGCPGLTIVDTDGSSLICAQDHSRRIFGIDPELVVVVATRCATYDRYRLAPVFGAVKRDIRHVD